MLRGKVKVGGPVGLHARPAAELVRAAEKFRCKVRLAKDGIWVNGKSILAILSLAAEMGSEVILEVDGPDEAQAFEILRNKLEHHESQG
uniref:HPr family phosphocarrier protein n=1 Tax=candidate division WOR-3 bacterium TaxID=2052148 RepID=A0A7C4GAH9_UNCW3